MTIVGWPLYSEFEVDKSLSGSPSSGILQALLREFGSSVDAETNSPVRYGKTYARDLQEVLFVARRLSLVRDPRRKRGNTGPRSGPHRLQTRKTYGDSSLRSE